MKTFVALLTVASRSVSSPVTGSPATHNRSSGFLATLLRALSVAAA